MSDEKTSKERELQFLVDQAQDLKLGYESSCGGGVASEKASIDPRLSPEQDGPACPGGLGSSEVAASPAATTQTVTSPDRYARAIEFLTASEERKAELIRLEADAMAGREAAPAVLSPAIRNKSNSAENRIAVLEKALDWYADPINWKRGEFEIMRNGKYICRAEADKGAVAKKALAETTRPDNAKGDK